MRSIRAIFIAAMLLQPVAAAATEPPRRLSHYTHQRWTEEGDAPAPVLSMAQGRDGFLWLATGEGLFRFDGVNFELVEAEGADRHDPPSAVLVARNGDVWTSFSGSRRFAVYRAGQLRVLSVPPAPDHILALAEAADGAIWALTAKFDGELLRLQNGKWRLFDAGNGLPHDNGLSLLVAADGAVWVSFCNSVVRLRPGAERFETVRKTPRANGMLSQDPAGRVWLSEKAGSYPITGSGGRGPPPPLRAPYPTDDSLIRGAPLFDHLGNLWIAMRYEGVRRVAAADPSGPLSQGANAQIKAYRSRDGLSSDVTNQVLEDREGNIWIGTEKGLDKFRPATLRSEPELNDPAAFGDKLMAASDGSVYIGQARAIYRVAPGGDPKPILRRVSEPQSLCEAPDGAIWIAFARSIVVWKQGRNIRTFPRPDTDSIVYDCAFDARGDYWISAGAGGLLRYRQGRWATMFERPAAREIHAMTMVRDARGQLVVQWADRKLIWIDYPTRKFTPFDLGPGEVALTLYPTPTGEVYAASAFGLSRFRDGHVETIRIDQPSPRTRISGLVRTPEGDTWIAYPRTLARIGPQDLERAFASHAFSPPGLSLGFGDGLMSRPHSHTQRSLVQGGDGRLWVATETGTLWMDPKHIVRTHLTPGVAIKSVMVDGHLHRDPVFLKLRPATTGVEIDYAVLSFADPKQANVRYRLEGFDKGWIDPGARRQAFYTNLKPGKYRFRVIAANDQGVWNQAGAAVDLEIPPTFLQSRGFIALCLGLAMGLLWLLYRLRVAQVAQGVRVGLEARLGERERIARELHDTLLQSVQGLVLRFQSVANRMPAGDKSRDLLESALKRADDVIVDGRNRVRDLRVAHSPGDLRAVLEESASAAGFDPTIPVRIVAEGAPRAVHPVVMAEAGRIAGEALFNIARHAGAKSVEIAISFAANQLFIQIRDDGVGFPEDIMAAGHKPGHFGLVGMRERAARIGGVLTFENRPEGGAEVSLKLPARLAFEDKAPRMRRLSSWLRRSRSVPGA